MPNNEDTIVKNTKKNHVANEVNFDNNNEGKISTRKKFKIPSSLSIIVGVFFFAILITWIVHFTNPDSNWYTYNGGEEAVADVWFNFGDTNWFVSSTGMYGIFDSLKATLAGGFDAFDVVLYVFTIGMIVEVLLVSGTMEAGVSSLVKGLNGHEIILVPALFFLFSVGGTTFGLQEETLGLIPIVVPVLILVGFDAVTGYLVIVLGTTTGIASSVLDPFSIGVMADGIGTNISTGIVVRLVLFIIYTFIGCVFVTWYAVRVRKDNEKSYDKDMLLANKKWSTEVIGDIENTDSLNKKQKRVLIIFGLTFGWMVFSLLPWTIWFPSLENNEGWTSFSSIFFGNVLLGQWYFMQLSVLFIFITYIMSKIFGFSNSEIWTNSKRAWKNLVGIALILIFSRAIAIVFEYSGATYTIIYALFNPESLDDHPIALSMSLLPLFILMAIFIPSTSGLAGVTAPIIAPIIDIMEDPESKQVAIIGILAIYPLAQGLINMTSPTSGITITQAELSRVNFAKVFPWTLMYGLVITVVGVISILTMLLFV